MRCVLSRLVLVAMAVGLTACASYAAADYRWEPGNPKFTTGLSAPRLVHR